MPSTLELESPIQAPIIQAEDDDPSFEEGELGVEPQKINLEKVDRSLSEFTRWHKSGRIIIDPEWQRNYVWDQGRASKLIESFLLDIPVPVVYLGKTTTGKYEVIDGLQRLTSVFNFFDNKFPLSSLDVYKNLTGLYFHELPPESQAKLEDATLRSFELASGSPDIHFLVFERLNTGGVKLNDMEIRNCIFRGKLNQLIKELADNDTFKKTLKQRGIEKRMLDRALVLRYLAFYEKTYNKCNVGLKKFLNDFLDTYKNANDNKLDEFKKSFEKSMRACQTVFGDNAFRLKADVTKPNSKSNGEWSTRPNAAIFQIISTSFSNYEISQITRAADAIYEEYLDLITSDPQWVDRVRRATGEQSRLHYTFKTWYNRLDRVLENYEPNDNKRCFSRQLKIELFTSNNTCSLCKQAITLIDDAALDHDKRYWEGGKTVPENARLVHRFCNQQKG